MSEHVDNHIGLTMGKTKIEEIRNSMGQHYFRASEPIGSMFGHEVHGEIEAFGKTKEIALDRLAKERNHLADSMWEEPNPKSEEDFQ